MNKCVNDEKQINNKMDTWSFYVACHLHQLWFLTKLLSPSQINCGPICKGEQSMKSSKNHHQHLSIKISTSKT